MWCRRNILTITGTWMEKEKCQMHGQVSIYWVESHLTDIHGPGEDWRGNKRPQDPTMCGQICGSICLMHRNAKKSKHRPSRSPKLENARRLRDMFFIELDDEYFKRKMKNASRKLDIPMPAAMPCWLQPHQHRETCGTVGQQKTKYACVVEAFESKRISMEGSQSKNHEDHIAGKGVNSLSHYNLVHKFISYAWSHENNRCKGSIGERMGKLEKHRHGSWRKSKTKVRWSLKQGIRDTLFILRRLWILESKHQKYKGRVVLRGDIVKDDSGSCAVFTEQGSSASQMMAAKVMDAPSLLKIPWSEFPDIWIRLPKHKYPKSLSSMGNLYGHLVAGLLWEKRFVWKTDCKKFQIWNVYSFPERRIILVCVRWRYQNDRKETKPGSNVEKYSWKKLIRENRKNPRIHYLGNSHWDSEDDGRIKVWTWAISRKDHLNVHVTMILCGELQEMKKFVQRILSTLRHTPKGSIRMMVISGTWLWEKVVWNSRQQAKWWMEQSCWDSWWSISLKAGILFFKPPVFWKEENWKVNVVERKPFTTTDVEKPLNWFFARLFLSLSSVSS